MRGTALFKSKAVPVPIPVPPFCSVLQTYIYLMLKQFYQQRLIWISDSRGSRLQMRARTSCPWAVPLEKNVQLWCFWWCNIASTYRWTCNSRVWWIRRRFQEGFLDLHQHKCFTKERCSSGWSSPAGLLEQKPEHLVQYCQEYLR